MIYQKQKFLYAHLPANTVGEYIRNQCSDGDVARLPEILSKWKIANQKFTELVKSEANIHKTIETKPIDSRFSTTLKEIAEDNTFKNAFADRLVEFKFVEIDKLIIHQNLVYFDFVENLKLKIPKEPTDDDLIKICLSLTKETSPVSELKLNDLSYVYSSDSPDFRFMGVASKNPEKSDVQNWVRA